MRSTTAKMKMRGVKLTALSWLLSMGAIMVLPLAAPAQFAEPLVPYGDQLPIPPGQPLPEPAPPPVGDGQSALPVIPGDRGAPLPPPSGVADNTGGSMFPTGTGHDRTTVYIFRRTGRGVRMDQTLRPNQLSDEQINKIDGILGINMLSGEQAIEIIASDSQIEQVNDVLAKYPQYESTGGRKKITKDAGENKVGWSSAYNKQSAYEFQGPLPTVKTFCRYLVILGVVSATIWMSIAATKVVLGHRDGGAAVIGTAAGLMLLLMGYTIWKVVQMNTFNANPDTPAISQNRPQEGLQSDAYIKGSTVPPTPSGGRQFPERSGIPLEPLGTVNQN